MYWQLEYLRKDATGTRNATYIEELPRNGFLGSLFLVMSSTNVSEAFATSLNWRLSDFISKVEIIGNGSEVIKSLSGNQLSAMMFFDQKVNSVDYWQSYGAGTTRFCVLLNFGRFLYDDMYGLDLSKFNRVEIKITNTATSTYLGADLAITSLMVMKRGEDASGFLGYFRTEEWRSWTTVSNATEYLELPTAYKIRRIVLQAIPGRDSTTHADDTGMSNEMYDIELALRSGVLKVFEGSIMDLMRLQHLYMGKFAESFPEFYLTADYGRYVGIGYVLGKVGLSGSIDGAVSSVVPTIKGSNSNGVQLFESYEGDSPVMGHMIGLCPENCLIIPFNQEDDPLKYLDPQTEETVTLNIQTRSGSSYDNGTNAVILDRFVSS